MNSTQEFIAVDRCGHNNQYERFTHIPHGHTVLYQPWMNDQDWVSAQIDYLEQFAGSVVIYGDQQGQYRPTEHVYGTVEEVLKQLRQHQPAPHTKETYCNYSLVVVSKKTGEHNTIVAANQHGVFIGYAAGFVKWNRLLADYVYPDGSHCGQPIIDKNQ